ncbi:UDP-N-acetylglucosamine 2-epimerase (non-hydrolyzing) [Microvirga sp. W0021]|uniref:UDP-N-acetylglucosamine 2-epimerase (non-hydrolyzing) n=1 Tax=Hohaiivirga grylli TaxID=3133970 RepID=A0ABV0BGV1_9HYPH
MRVLSIFGTRPEAVKMAPVVKALAKESGIHSHICVTGQHREMLTQVLELFDIHPDYDLAVMRPNQGLNGLTTRVIDKLDTILADTNPDMILAHGDTTTAMAAGLAAFHRGIKIGHVEAGLRTYDVTRPWPEEMNRRVLDVVSTKLFAPTEQSAQNLKQEKLNGEIIITGNTVIDALFLTVDKIANDPVLKSQLDEQFSFINPKNRLLLVTGHRRESFGDGFSNICKALAELSKRPDIDIVYPVHLNPNVDGPVRESLAGCHNVHLIKPLDYLLFVYLMQRSDIILTDSGGVQEEAPSLGKPVLVMRDVTERPEAVAAGCVKLVGTDKKQIIENVNQLLDDKNHYASFARKINPYGDGKASQRIVSSLLGEPFKQFIP